MKLNRIHTIIGLLLILIPFTGFTRGFKYGFSVLAGGVILFFAMKSIHQEIMKKQNRYRKHDTYVESKPKESIYNKSKDGILNKIDNLEKENIENNNPHSNHIAND